MTIRRLGDRCRHVSTTQGTGALTLDPPELGFQAISAIPQFASGAEEFPYGWEGRDSNGDLTGEWEDGKGHLDGSGHLVRSVVYASSNGGALVDISSFSVIVFVTVNADGLAEWLDGQNVVKNPSGVTDNRIARFDGVTGRLIQDSGVSITDGGVVLNTSGAIGGPSVSFAADQAAGLSHVDLFGIGVASPSIQTGAAGYWAADGTGIIKNGLILFVPSPIVPFIISGAADGTDSRFEIDSAGRIYLKETTAPSPSAGDDVVYADAAQHRLMLSNNGGAFSPVMTRADVFSSSVAGIVPASGGGTTNFIRADGTWAAPPTSPPGDSPGAVQFNNGGAFGGDAANLFWDATNKRLGVGTSTPDQGSLGGSGITIQGSVGSPAQLVVHNSFAAGMEFYVHSDTSFRAPSVNLFRSRGTKASPTTVSAADPLGYMGIYAYDGVAYAQGAQIQADASETWNAGAHGATLSFLTTAPGSTSPASRLTVDASGIILRSSAPRITTVANENLNLSPNGIGKVVVNTSLGVGTVPVHFVDIAAGSIADATFGLRLTGTLPTIASTAAIGASISFTSAGSSAQDQRGFQSILIAGYTGPNNTYAGLFSNNAASSDTHNPITNPTVFGAATGMAGFAHGATAGNHVGSWGYADTGTTNNIGALGYGWTTTGMTGFAYGTIGVATAAGGNAGPGIGGYFAVSNGGGTITGAGSAALIADNVDTTMPILLARKNGTNVFSVLDSGLLTRVPAAALSAGQRADTLTTTLPSGSGSGQLAVLWNITSAGAGVGGQYGFVVSLLAGYTGTTFTTAANFENVAAGTGAWNPATQATVGQPPGPNVGFWAQAHGSTIGTNAASVGVAALGAINVGSYGAAGDTIEANNGYRVDSINYGMVGVATLAKNASSTTEKHTGVLGLALGGDVNVGGYFGLQNTTPALASAALIADNGGTTNPIAILRDNGTPVATWKDGGVQLNTNDIVVDTASHGLVLKDTQGTPHYWRVTVSNAGALVVTDIGTTAP